MKGIIICLLILIKSSWKSFKDDFFKNLMNVNYGRSWKNELETRHFFNDVEDLRNSNMDEKDLWLYNLPQGAKEASKESKSIIRSRKQKYIE